MTPDAFIAKWQANVRGERAVAQEHFLDLCALLGEPTPNSDPTGAAYAFEKGATQASGREGWAGVWRRGRFAWEYKGKHRDLNAVPRDAAAAENLRRRTLTNLYNTRATPEGHWLDALHRDLDEAVAAAYDFPADLPEDEVLARLLALNHARAAL